MCGIVAYIGNKQAYPILIKGLKRLEYRGYDSAGIALENNGLNIYKTKGKVSDLEATVLNENIDGHLGMGHTRWATHGEPNTPNAHPHVSNNGKYAIIHNGIIENYGTLKKVLLERGYVFRSETDTEVLVHLIEEIKNKNKVDLSEAIRLALHEVVGAYAMVVISSDHPDTLIGAKKGSPMVIGYGADKGEFFIASDATPIIEYTKKVTYLEDGQIVTCKKDGSFSIKTIENVPITPFIQELQLNLEAIEKGGYEYFMLKEIFEQPKSILDSFRGRFNLNNLDFAMRSLHEFEHKIKNLDRIIIVACGTSWHAGLIGEYLLEDFARIPTEVEYASEFRYRNPVISEDDLVIAISQSGETADTLAALELAKEKGATLYGICNVVGSSIPRLTDAGAYTHAGPEIGVASTKAFTAQLTVLTLIALGIAKIRGAINNQKLRETLTELESLPSKVESMLKNSAQQIELIAERFKDATNFLYLGRGYNFPVALEGALKLKEISYIHAEGYPAAEMKHGPIALIDENMPVVVIALFTEHYEKILSNIEEIKARKGVIIAIVTEGDTQVKAIADYCIEIPPVQEQLSPVLSTIPLQLLAYHIAVLRDCNVDQPRNLAKSVTVE